MSAGPTLAEVDDGAVRTALERTWARPGGLLGLLGAVNHKTVAGRYLVSAFVFFGLGGVLALLMRLQLAFPEARLLGPDLYDQVFTVHGSTMMFLFAVPVMEGMAVYLVPLMVGTRNVAFPRLNAFGYYVFLFGGLMLYAFFFINAGPAGSATCPWPGPSKRRASASTCGRR